MTETERVPKLTVRFEHEHDKFPEPGYWETKVSHIPQLDETVCLPREFYKTPCVVENVIWNFGLGEPWHVKVLLTE